MVESDFDFFDSEGQDSFSSIPVQQLKNNKKFGKLQSGITKVGVNGKKIRPSSASILKTRA